MKYRFIFFILSVFIFTSLSAQKKEIEQVRNFLKSGKDYDKAYSILDKLLKKPEHKTNERLLALQLEVMKRQYDVLNENFYLKKNTDTLKLTSKAYELFELCELIDSIDATPDAKGKVRLKYREKNAELLNTYRPNIFSGGAYFSRNNKHEKASQYLLKYIGCARMPMFAAYDYANTDPQMPYASSLALYSLYKCNRYADALELKDDALRDTIHTRMIIQLSAECYKALGKEDGYEEMLTMGFDKYPLEPYFYTRLVERYEQKNDTASTIATTNKVLALDSANVVARLVKTAMLLKTSDIDECIAQASTLIEEGNALPDTYYTLALAYKQKAEDIEKQVRKKRSMKQMVASYYQKALEPMEKFRELQPAAKDKWAPVLYNLYLKLNKGSQFEEIDMIMRELSDSTTASNNN